MSRLLQEYDTVSLPRGGINPEQPSKNAAAAGNLLVDTAVHGQGESRSWSSFDAEVYLDNVVLTRSQPYPVTSELHQLVTQKVAGLSEAAGVNDVKVVVIQNDEPNAFALPGHVVVHDGLLRTLASQEEVDGILAHELAHLKRQHSLKRGGSQSILDCIGQERAQETEADLVALEILDKSGKNAQGFVSALRRLYVYQATKNAQPIEDIDFIDFSADYTHGNPEDRSLNLEDSFWLVDIRNLKHTKMTPLELGETAFMPPQSGNLTKEQWAEYQRASPKQRLQTLRRQYHTLSESAYAGESFEPMTLRRREMEKIDQAFSELCRTIDPMLDAQTIEQLTYTMHFFDAERIAEKFDPLDAQTVVQHWSAMQSKVLAMLGFRAEEGQSEYLKHLTERYCSRIDTHAAFPLKDIQTIESCIDSSDGSSNRFIKIVLQHTVFENCYTVEDYSEAYRAGFMDYVTSSSLSLDDIKAAEVHIRRTVPESKPFDGIADEVLSARSDIASAIEEDTSFVKYVVDNSQDLEWESLSDAWTSAARERLATLIGERTLAEFMAMIPKADYQKSDFEYGELFTTAASLYARYWPNEANTEVDLATYLRDEEVFDELHEDDENWKGSQLLAEFTEAYRAIAELEIGEPLEDFTARLSEYLAYELLQEGLERHLQEETGPPLAELLSNKTLWGDSLDSVRSNIQPAEWDRLVSEVFADEHANLDVKELLLNFVALGLLSNDLQVQLQVPAAAMQELVRQLPFDEALQLVFETYNHLPAYVFRDSINYLIEEAATTIEQLATIEAALERNLEHYSGLHADVIGKFSVLETIGFGTYAKLHRDKHGISGLENKQLLTALLGTGTTDQALHDYLFPRWWQQQRVYRDLDIKTAVRLQGKTSALEYWSRAVDETAQHNFGQYLSHLYSSNGFSRSYMLRKLLLGREGVLTSTAGRQEFAQMFEQLCVQTDGSELAANLHTFIEGLFGVTSGSRLYQYLGPVLQARMLVYPEQPTSLEQTAWRASGRIVKQLTHQYGRDLSTLHEPIARRLALIMGANAGIQLHTKASSDQRLLQRFANDTRVRQSALFTPTDLLLTSGEKSGALGIRMLQLAGQYFAIPEEQAERFNQVYDNNSSQSRLQAYRVLRREAETSGVIAELLNGITNFSPRVGGGSLMTVYDVELADGRREAVAIKNPNAEYHVTKMVDTMKQALQAAQANDPNNRNFTLIAALLDDVAEWIHDELNDTEFARKDVMFRIQNDSRFSNPVPDDRYKLLVPDTALTDSLWVRREAYVEGRNLTGLHMTDAPSDIPAGVINSDDFKAVVTTIAKNFFSQIQNGLVHSDIHPGNFRVTNDNQQIAIFDRYNLLELKPEDQQVLTDVVGNVFMGQTQQAVNSMVDYLFTFDRNQGIQVSKEQLSEQLTRELNTDDITTSVSGMVTGLKQSGVYVPLKLSLILKNFLALNTLAKRAGFANVIEALV